MLICTGNIPSLFPPCLLPRLPFIGLVSFFFSRSKCNVNNLDSDYFISVIAHRCSYLLLSRRRYRIFDSFNFSLFSDFFSLKRLPALK